MRFLFVGTKKQASEVVALEAGSTSTSAGGRHAHQLDHDEGRIRLKDLERMESSGAIAMRPKRVRCSP